MSFFVVGDTHRPKRLFLVISLPVITENVLPYSPPLGNNVFNFSVCKPARHAVCHCAALVGVAAGSAA